MLNYAASEGVSAENLYSSIESEFDMTYDEFIIALVDEAIDSEMEAVYEALGESLYNGEYEYDGTTLFVDGCEYAVSIKADRMKLEVTDAGDIEALAEVGLEPPLLFIRRG